ncbi:MAG TPA: hypothetical protein DDY49_15000 [Paenibacillaceae bacterium]|nr:hypothetical protein [Paenibacillaceae bacterium]
MKKRLGTSKWTMVVLFILMFGIALSGGMYRNATAEESAKFKVTVPGNSTKEVVLDINDQGLPKKLIQPGMVTISSGHGKGNLVYEGKKPAFIQFKFSNFPGKVEVRYRGPYDEKTGRILKPIKPGDSISIDFGVELPADVRKQAVVFIGEIQLMDWKTNKLIGTIPVKIINSKYETNTGATNNQNDNKESCH